MMMLKLGVWNLNQIDSHTLPLPKVLLQDSHQNLDQHGIFSLRVQLLDHDEDFEMMMIELVVVDFDVDRVVMVLYCNNLACYFWEQMLSLFHSLH
jgi:hypothetical protein